VWIKLRTRPWRGSRLTEESGYYLKSLQKHQMAFKQWRRYAQSHFEMITCLPDLEGVDVERLEIVEWFFTLSKYFKPIF
jgi:hypothetical protein